jgi:hypothetical protein
MNGSILRMAEKGGRKNRSRWMSAGKVDGQLSRAKYKNR